VVVARGDGRGEAAGNAVCEADARGGATDAGLGALGDGRTDATDVDGAGAGGGSRGATGCCAAVTGGMARDGTIAAGAGGCAIVDPGAVPRSDVAAGGDVADVVAGATVDGFGAGGDACRTDGAADGRESGGGDGADGASRRITADAPPNPMMSAAAPYSTMVRNDSRPRGVSRGYPSVASTASDRASRFVSSPPAARSAGLRRSASRIELTVGFPTDPPRRHRRWPPAPSASHPPHMTR